MSLIKRLLDEKDSLSMMRFLCLLSMILGGIIGLYGIYKGQDLTGVAALCAVFVGAAIGGKAAQKNIENKITADKVTIQE
jgi:uncharacterized membrane protein